jgi:signal transduction histidine kinase
MNGPYDIGGAAAYALVATVWAIVSADAWRFRLASRPRSALYRLLPSFATAMACLYGLYVLVALLLPAQWSERAPRWFELTDVALLASLALFRHLTWHARLDAPPPSGGWLALTFGSAALLAVTAVFPEVVPLPTLEQRVAFHRVLMPFYVVGMLGFGLRDVRRSVRPGRWRGIAAVARGADALVMALAVAGATLLFAILTAEAPRGWPLGYVQPPPLLSAGFGLLVGVPFAGRILGDVVRRLLFVLAVVAATALAWGGVLATDRRIANPALRDLAGFAVVATLVLVLLAAQRPLRAAIDRLVFRRRHRRRAELQAMLQSLSPELGARECCRRAAAAATRILGLRGVAVLLTRGRGEVVAGDLDAAPLRAAWGDGSVATALPSQPFAIGSLRELPPPLRDALIDTDVVGGVAITSPHQRWGAAFVTSGRLGMVLAAEDRQAIEAMAGQLALILDGTELLERAVAVERSLAHAEKLAAIGETAARIAHDIRNPVTAARSLAQQLARGSTSGDRDAADVIVEELDRVEQQVAALLRFSRREEFRFGPVDLGALARAVLGPLRPRLEAAHIHTELDAPDGIVARADGEKMRQVILNLVENALEALHEADDPRHLVVVVSGKNGMARLQVGDTGPGVPAEALPRLFEPFFSLKPTGTGLGLAIAKRTVDGHGGLITATGSSGHGLRIEVELPLAVGS